MEPITATLLQVQNLEFTIEDSQIINDLHPHHPVIQELKEKVQELKNSLPAEHVLHYERMSKSYEIVVVPMLNGTCTGCFMKLPVWEINKITAKREVVKCPNCQRFLYYEEQKGPQIVYPDYKGIAKFSSIDLMFPDIKGNDKLKILEEIGQKIYEAGFVTEKKEFISTLIKREKLLSTAVGSEIAFPHARGPFASRVTLAIALVKEGVDFGEEEIVKIICIFALPTQVNKFYLDIMSKLAAYFEKEQNRDKLLKCETAKDMWKILVRIGK